MPNLNVRVPVPVPDEPTPDVHDLMEEIAVLVVKQMKGMQDISFSTVVFPRGISPTRITIQLEPGTR